MRVATIDIGTNSVLLLIAQATDPENLVPVYEASTITRLGQGVDQTRRLHGDAVDRTLRCLEGYAEVIRQHDVTRMDVVSTSAARDAAGAEVFLDAAGSVLGVRPRVISGEQEAQLTFLGALTGLALDGAVAVYDIGGGSTEVVFGVRDPGRRPTVHAATSLDVGCVRLSERHIRSDPPTSLELERAKAAAAEAFSGLSRPEEPCTWIGIGGTITTLMSIEMGMVSYDAKRVHGSTLTLEAVVGLRDRLAGVPLVDRKRVVGLEPKRADVIVAGALLVEQILRIAGQKQTYVSDRGVRWGLALQLCSPTLGPSPG